MNYEIFKPIKKSNNHIAKVTINNKPITLKLYDVKIADIKTVPNGYLLRLWIHKNNEGYQTIEDLDKFALSECIIQNNGWFNNTLDETAIKDFFRPSLNTEFNTMVVGMENTAGRIPIILINGKSQNSIDEKILKNTEVTIQMETLGVHFFKTKFGIKWNIRKLVYNTNDVEIDTDKTDIELQWTKDLEDFAETIEKDCEKRREYLLKAQILLDEITKISEVNKTWNKNCEILSKLISDYKSL